MNQEFLNIYIEQLNGQLTDIFKQQILTNTQLKYTEKLNVQLSERILQLENELNILNTQKSDLSKSLEIEKTKKTKKNTDINTDVF